LSVTLDLFPPWFLRVFLTAFGLLWGSFLNVVIHRVPRGMSVVRPPSHCPKCEKPIRAWQNVPVFGWLFLRGRSACCGERISIRYPLVELIGGVLALAIVELLVLSLPQAVTPALFGFALFASSFTLAMGLVATAFIDMEHLVILPDRANIAGGLIGIGTASLRGLSYFDCLIGAAVGFAIGYGIDTLYRMIRGRSGFASGDTVLLAVMGCWFGWAGALFALVAGAVQGTIIILIVRVFGGAVAEPEVVKREREEIRAEIDKLPAEEREKAMAEWRAEDELADEPGEGMQAPLPFGPFIAMAGIELLLFEAFLKDLFFLWMGP
jgi:leader peptidase (prepilin peptidase)/N-methyltransferase